MRLRVFWTGTYDESTINYQDFQFDTWEVVGGLLVIHQSAGARYLPLVGLKSFKELQGE